VNDKNDTNADWWPEPADPADPAEDTDRAKPADTTGAARPGRIRRAAGSQKAKIAGALMVGGVAGAAILGPLSTMAASPAPTESSAPTSGSGGTGGSGSSGTTTPATGDQDQDGRGGRGGPGGHNEAVSDTSVVAKAIGISEADLTTALQGGQTVAQVAAAHNVDLQVVIDALIADGQAELDAAVKAGTITQAQADAEKTELTQRATDQANGNFQGGGRH
jgi:hypothetical protein